MPVTDPVADMLTRVRNALGAKHETVNMPASKMKKSIAAILLKEGFIKGYEYKDEGPQGVITIALKYGAKEESVINGLKRISKPGLRVYAKRDDVPKVLGGLGVAIISTSKGIMTDRDARNSDVGGEVIAYVW